MPVLTPASGEAIVRMYDPGGLGDCFLLAFAGNSDTGPDTGTGVRYVLIDCGVFNGTSGGADRMRTIAKDIVDATGGHLHTLVLTHEHWDHLSGFQWAHNTFKKKLQIDEVWAAWTENPKDNDAVRLQRELDSTFGTLAAAATRLRKTGDSGLEARAAEIEGVLGFVGFGAASSHLRVLAGAPERFGAKRSMGTARQMDFALTLGDEVRYLSPGDDPIEVTSGVRAFPLGPPRDEDFLRRSDPRADEVYEHAADAPAHTPDGLTSAFASDEDPAAPFGPDRGVRLSHIPAPDPGDPTAVGSFFAAHYGTGDGEDDAPAWRRIDDDWLGAAEGLALQLDNDINNTSLVLAFELSDGRVLLFPGDAQVGNWLSWHDVEWEDDGTTVTAEDLLARTVLYKVGHHASHNATLRARGLELMTDPRLVALVPVNEAQAKKKKWAMPFEPLDARLQEKCAGRVLRADTKVPDRPAGVSQSAWNRFLDRVTVAEDGLWVQVEV